MKTTRNYPAVQVTKKAETSVRNGHPWVYEDEIITQQTQPKDGELADVFDQRGKYLGTGFYNSHSKIRIRLLSDNANDRFDEAFFARRIGYAIDYRRSVMPQDFGCCRLIFGEADALPGLTVDRYENLLAVQILCLGMEKRRDMLLSVLMRELELRGVAIDGIFLRNDVAIRNLEGLKEEKGWYDLGKPIPSPITQITENGILYQVDVENGQKTGFFLDQKYNRLAVGRLAAGKRVLDCFTHTGSFGLNAAYQGASHVTCVDVSQTAVEMAKENAKQNSLTDKMDFLCADVFELLPTLVAQKQQPYDMIILDPPAFTKSRKTADAAYDGYREINRLAMQILPRGGFLATCSCSHFMPCWRFEEMLKAAALQARKQLRQIEVRQQAPDHPILWNVPETDYLKCYLFQVI